MKKNLDKIQQKSFVLKNDNEKCLIKNHQDILLIVNTDDLSLVNKKNHIKSYIIKKGKLKSHNHLIRRHRKRFF